jgi:arylsulfatase A-like enzyme
MGRWRYRLVVGLIWLAVAAAAAAGWFYARSSGPAYGPVVVISIESLRADRLPVYGYTRVRTPSIDALAADAVTFDRAYAHSPLTLPSHVSILSGLLPFQTGVRDEVGFPIPASAPLLPQLLRKRGFKAGGMVSNYLLRKETGLGAAFSFFDDELGVGAAEGAAPPAARDSADTLKVAQRWIESIGTERFFLFLHLDGMGPAAEVPARFAKLSPYDGRIAYADELVGGLIAFLKKRGLYNGGIVVLTSDHGESLGNHGEQGHGLMLYEAAVRVPLIVKLPRRDGGGRHSTALVQHADIVPTILDLTGAPTPSAVRGRSLRRVLDSPTATLADRAVYAESAAGRYRFGWGEVASLTDGQHRYIRSARPELYDLVKDPGERATLVDAEAQKAQAMRTALDALTGTAPLPAPAPVAEPERSRLAAMGYVAGLPGVAPDVPGDQLPDVKDTVGAANAYWQATALAARGRAAEAAAKYAELVAADPGLAIGWARLADVLAADGRFKEAARALASLVALFPEAERVAEAEQRIPQLIGPEPTAAHYALAISVWTSLGEKAKAAEVRAAARKAVGDAALRKAQAAFRD